VEGIGLTREELGECVTLAIAEFEEDQEAHFSVSTTEIPRHGLLIIISKEVESPEDVK